ncbi:hypothetical protein [Peribacillus aracenensis]|uniref:hypothetical protein n=1 Tax=Peribacillus aracenensis TaxID=2976708 RepID=UPI0021A432E1|nr:hypothetical protein [Peribacillus sp. BBB004]
MRINLQVYLHAHGSRFLKSGVFPVNVSEFKKEPDQAAAVSAYEWIRAINKEMGFSKDFRIDKVIYDQEHDITEIVRQKTPHSKREGAFYA